MIGMAGMAGSGKDTAGEYLAQRLGVETYALADPIYALVGTLFGITKATMQDRKLKERRLYYRVTAESLQETGELYYKLGLGKYEEFHDAWESWIELLNLKYEESARFGVYVSFISIRTCLQTIGTEWGRSVKDDMWIDLVPDSNPVVTDVRMENEAQALRDRGYSILRVLRPSQKAIENSGHSTEAGLPDTLITREVLNDTTINNLYKKLDKLISTSV